MRRLRRLVDQDELPAGLPRVGIAGVGLLLWWFGVVTFGSHVSFFTTQPPPAPSIGGNGLLAAFCLLCGACLIVAAIRGGAASASAATAVGLVYLVLGVGSLFVFQTPGNVLAVTLPDALLGIVAGFVLLAFGVPATPSARALVPLRKMK
jgi:hypothetical protein